MLMKVDRVISVDVPNLGDRIKAAREEAQKTRSLTKIAGEAGMTTANWYRIENERQRLPEETLRKIEKALGVDFGIEFPKTDF